MTAVNFATFSAQTPSLEDLHTAKLDMRTARRIRNLEGPRVCKSKVRVPFLHWVEAELAAPGPDFAQSRVKSKACTCTALLLNIFLIDISAKLVILM